MVHGRGPDWESGGDIGNRLHALAAELFPICRSITGVGLRETLRRLARYVPLAIQEVPSGTRVFDWTVPPEWSIREAWIKGPTGQRVIDFRSSNLHVLHYSVPVHNVLPLGRLRNHIYTLPELPDVVPYRASFYQRRWGFCMAHSQLVHLREGLYEVFIDSSLYCGSMTYGEFLHTGQSSDEVLLTTHVCRPSLANDNCSGMAVLAHLAQWIISCRTRYSYRFVFAPETIGAVAWLAANEHRVSRIKHGLVVSCLGDSGGPTYMRSRRGDATIDRVMRHVLRHPAPQGRILDFCPYGSDQRQYCSPGFNLPVGLFQRSQFGTFKQQYTSADDLDFISPDELAMSYRMLAAAVSILETDHYLVNTMPKGEPHLARRNLLAEAARPHGQSHQHAMHWVLNLADGEHSLLDIAERAGLPFDVIAAAATLLERHGLLASSPDRAAP